MVNGSYTGDIDVFMQELSDQVRNYLIAAYDYDLNEEVWNVPSENVALGLIIAGFETMSSMQRSSIKLGIKITDQYSLDGDPGDCFMSVIMDMIGIGGGLMAIYSDFKSGNVSKKTAIRTIRYALRRVATAASVAYAVYQVGQCFDWW